MILHASITVIYPTPCWQNCWGIVWNAHSFCCCLDWERMHHSLVRVPHHLFVRLKFGVSWGYHHLEIWSLENLLPPSTTETTFAVISLLDTRGGWLVQMACSALCLLEKCSFLQARAKTRKACVHWWTSARMEWHPTCFSSRTVWMKRKWWGDNAVIRRTSWSGVWHNIVVSIFSPVIWRPVVELAAVRREPDLVTLSQNFYVSFSNQDTIIRIFMDDLNPVIQSSHNSTRTNITFHRTPTDSETAANVLISDNDMDLTFDGHLNWTDILHPDFTVKRSICLVQSS